MSSSGALKSSTVQLFEEIAGACRGLRKIRARYNNKRFPIRTDCKFDDVYFVVLGLTLWADCALSSARRTNTRWWLVPGLLHTALAFAVFRGTGCCSSRFSVDACQF